MRTLLRLVLCVMGLLGYEARAQVPAGRRGDLAGATTPVPTGVTATVSGKAALVAWTAARGALAYHVLRATDSTKPGADVTGATPALTFTDPNVVPGTTYFYQVTAVFAGNKVSAAAPVRFQLPAAPVAVALPYTRLTAQKVVPANVPAMVGSFVVKGTGLDRLTDVRLGGVPVTWKKEVCPNFNGGDSSIVVSFPTSPSGSPLTGPQALQLTGPNGSATLSVTIDRASIDATGVNPTSALAGDWVSISGPHLADILHYQMIGYCGAPLGTTAHVDPMVTFNGYKATAVATDGIYIRAQVPPHATGKISVGTQWHGSAWWSGTFVEHPTITAQALGFTTPGGTWFFTGTALDGIDSVRIAGLGYGLFPITTRTYNRLEFSVPASEPVNVTQRDLPLSVYAKVPEQLIKLNGQSPTISILPITKIAKVSPDSGWPGDNIQLEGTGLTDAPQGMTRWAPAVWFNGAGALWTTTNTATIISATIPQGATTGPVAFAVGPNAPRTQGPVVRILQTPRLMRSSSGLLPVYPTGARVGDAVQIYLESGTNITAVSFGGTVVTTGWTVVPNANGGPVASIIRMAVPPGAKTGPVIVTTTTGSTSWTANVPFTVFP